MQARSRTPSPERKRSQSETGTNPSQPLVASLESPNPLQRESSAKVKKKFGVISTKIGAQKHHPEYTNATGKVIKIDKWAIDEMEVSSFLKFNERNKADLIRDVVSQWNCESTIIDDLLKTLETDFGESDDLSDQDLELIDYLASLKENIEELRVKDLAIQCTHSFTIKTNPAVVTKGDKLDIKLTLDWKDILKEGRKLVKEQLVAGKANPSKDDVSKIVDKALKKMALKDKEKTQKQSAEYTKVEKDIKLNKYASTDPLYKNSAKTEESLQRLYAFGFLQEPAVHGKNTVTSDELTFKGSNIKKDKVILESTTPTFKQLKDDKTEKDVKPTFEFSKGHVRFILYLEWKAISQLLKLTEVYK